MIDREQLESAVRDAEPPELFALAGELQGRAFAAACPEPPEPPPPPEPPAAPTRLIDAQEAGAIAGVPTKRVYEWARNKAWANRPTRRCLRIDEAAFPAWLAGR